MILKRQKRNLIIFITGILIIALTGCDKKVEINYEIDKDLIEQVEVISVYPDSKNDEVTVTVLNNSDKELSYIECIVSLYDSNDTLVGKVKAKFNGILIAGNLQNIKAEVTQQYVKAEAEVKNVKAE